MRGHCWPVASLPCRLLQCQVATGAHTCCGPTSLPLIMPLQLKLPCAGGLVGSASFAALPQVSSPVAALSVLSSLLPCLACTWQTPDPGTFASAAAYSSLAGFMVGYHVHEKAILTTSLLLVLGAVGSTQGARRCLFVGTLGHHALLPLLFTLEEYPIKVMEAEAPKPLLACAVTVRLHLLSLAPSNLTRQHKLSQHHRLRPLYSMCRGQ